MKEKLKEYIDCTNGDILTALSFDIDYLSALGIRVTVLRAQLNDHGIYTGTSEETREIRTSKGSVSSITEALSLSLHDLGLPKTDELLQEPRLLISANEICCWVDEAAEYEKTGVAETAAAETAAEMASAEDRQRLGLRDFEAGTVIRAIMMNERRRCCGRCGKWPC
ncbi:hypothetical protein PV04_08509 [Phialophora macrospora]|uniref:Uncharacterized protein n=1 Tax=Phialophora macrospora TaxID=1851006 RepID=A0A0D2CEL7_9EURO|nr:hypothetical protein PV04_08509 [Phialophora macrospora]